MVAIPEMLNSFLTFLLTTVLISSGNFYSYEKRSDRVNGPANVKGKINEVTLLREWGGSVCRAQPN